MPQPGHPQYSGRQEGEEAMLVLNFNNMLIAPGQKLFVVRTAEQRQGKGSGEDYVSVRTEIVSGEGEGRSLFVNISAHERALWRAQQILAAMDIPHNGTVELDPKDLIGKRFKATVSHVPVKDKEGEFQEELSEFAPAH
jgi:hypothetical protein